MDNIFVVVLFISLIALGIGMIKPSIVIKWKEEAKRIDVLKVYGIAIVISFVIVGIFASPVEKKEVIQEVQKKQVEQVKMVDKHIISSTKKINVVLNETIQNDNGKITIKGTTNLPNNTKILVYISSDLYNANDSFEILNGSFTSATFSNQGKPLFNGKYEISIRTKSYKEQPKNVQHLMGKDGINLVGKLIFKNEYFHDNNLHYKTSYTIDNSIDKKEIVSITSTQLKQIIKSLKENYRITATDFNNAELNKFKMCLNERFCEVYADKVQIQAIYKKIDVLTSSQVTPLYYQKVCSATMIALTGANKELIEQSIPQYFNYASKNGSSRWKVLGIELTITPDSQGLLGCSFYKQ